MPDRAPRVAVCGAGTTDAALERVAEEVGRRIAEAGGVLICGGLGGVMAAAARGAAAAGGVTIGLLPGTDATGANPHISIPLPTGLGESRNALVARTAGAVIAIGGEWGTLSEIAFARKVDVPVVLLAPSRLTAAVALFGLETAPSPEAAVARALELARGHA
jgi:hypothetical protein